MASTLLGKLMNSALEDISSEYDALPGAKALVDLKVAGRIRILGTPAEEGGGGKVKLIEARAFTPREDIAAAFMIHPIS
ncbi:hypothetical protein FOXG_21669 [Fusarium oxysporum f. sp. lycopersici 4287]|uniref:Uncharacterized protein n=2 Tax=Fusarium oxysporum TaxID=5507 RepID=A0A0J9W039_FUSO4|nr:hypothetical protein FOXG_21669 [Fusarium oxysporum f. sp. lycopersici 4287]EXK35688.1 hypothetical protein FOMG_08897 [Fusarium oxysporum f. sp. melonis 26406]KNB16428.1 hypothetical protein FOXG_21669 [Fusarium oxysporum f. sp. lycopersici 4287]